MSSGKKKPKSTKNAPPVDVQSRTGFRIGTVTSTRTTSETSTFTVLRTSSATTTVKATVTSSAINTFAVPHTSSVTSPLKATGRTSGISNFTVPCSSSATRTLEATGTTPGISTFTVPHTSSATGTLKATGTTFGISTVTVAATTSGIHTITGTDTTSGISIVTVAATTSGIGAVRATNTGNITDSGTSLGTALVGYVHNVSPVKRNKRNTLNYSTFTLQVRENSMQDALCYSTTKRAILAEKEASRTPIKIARFTRTADHTKLVVNDIAHVTAPNSLECPFQFCQNLDNQTTTTLEKLDEAPEDKLTIFCKVLKLSETKVVGRAKYNVANATIADNTGQITLDVWNNLIPQIQENKVYKFTNLSVRFWNGVRKLTTTTNSVVLETPNPLLEGLEVEDTSSPYQETTLLLSRIESIESVEKYKICGHCAKRIIQVQGLLVNCDHCHHKLRASSCPTKLSASIVVKNESTKLYLSVRDHVLQQLLGPYDPDDIDTNHIEEKPLFLEKIAITYTDGNKVTSITTTSTPS